jgi:hypothetical protein
MQFRLRRAFNQDRNTSGGIPPLIIVRIHPSVRRDLELGRHALLCYHRDGPAHRIAGLMLLYRTDHPRDRQSVQHHSRLLAPILGEAATSGLYRISNIDSLHASPAVAVRETVPRRPARYRATVNNDPEPPLYVRVNHHNALKSSGTSPNFRNTVASWKSPVAGSPVRLSATERVWPSTFQRPCARSIAAAGLGHSIGSPTTTLLSATSNGNATKYVIPATAPPTQSYQSLRPRGTGSNLPRA